MVEPGVRVGWGREVSHHALPGGTKFGALPPHGRRGNQPRGLLAPQTRRPSCMEESRPLLNIPLFLRGLVSDTKCKSRWGGM